MLVLSGTILFLSPPGRVKELELVVFDMAGTTVEVRGQVGDAFVAALAGHGTAITPEALTRTQQDTDTMQGDTGLTQVITAES